MCSTTFHVISWKFCLFSGQCRTCSSLKSMVVSLKCFKICNNIRVLFIKTLHTAQVHCPKNLRIKTKPVTAGADTAVYCTICLPVSIYTIQYCTVVISYNRDRLGFYAKILIIFGTVAYPVYRHDITDNCYSNLIIRTEKLNYEARSIQDGWRYHLYDRLKTTP